MDSKLKQSLLIVLGIMPIVLMSILTYLLFYGFSNTFFPSLGVWMIALIWILVIYFSSSCIYFGVTGQPPFFAKWMANDTSFNKLIENDTNLKRKTVFRIISIISVGVMFLVSFVFKESWETFIINILILLILCLIFCFLYRDDLRRD